MAAIAALVIMSGCGGGGGGSTAPTVKSNYGRMAAELHFNGRGAGRVAGAAATGTVNIAVTISGYYSMDDSAFPTMTAQTEIDAAGGNATVSILEVPIGVNHLLTAVATWPDGVTDTIKYIIPEVREGELTPVVADYRTTVIANAAIALAERDEVKLSEITQSQIDTLTAAVDAFLAAGYAASDININDVLDYETTGNVLSTIVVSPATATVLVDATAQFTATPKNAYGIAVAGTVTWSVTGSVGTIDSTGLFTASTAGSGTVVATSGTISGSAAVTVTSSTSTPVCGNGTPESGETCDDGANNGQPNYCNATCDGTTTSVCGNSMTESGETCDDGNTDNTDVCLDTCVAASCGDGYTQSGVETCDDGANNGQPNYCNTTCNGTTTSVCGNSVTESGETCDDGNTTTETCAYGDTSCTVCDATCLSVAGATSYCGDSTADSANGETCDDGNTTTEACAYGDTSCTVCGATCLSVAGATSYCGDATTDAANGETCDDGNTTTEACAYGAMSCTVCDATCLSAAGATSYCGDATTDAANGETCDDGNAVNTDACLATCIVATCGDGFTQSGVEACDDGNLTSGDGCSSTCTNDAMATNAWITIPAGDFVMGCATGDASCNVDGREAPKHTVTLSQYKIQKYEVTNAQYAACVTATSCTAPSNANSSTRTPYYGNATYDNYPVLYISWNMATAYCAWIGGRLPTEAEWEKAARGPSPSESIHPWGNGAANCTLANYAGCTGDTDEVGSHPTGASYYGVLDMGGNAKEWVNDWFSATYYATSPSTDPPGPVSGSYRVLRGNSYYGGATELRASDRDRWTQTAVDIGYGFRCAQD